MALSCANLSFREVTQQQVVEVIRDELPGHDAFVSPKLNGWVTVYDADADATGEDIIPPYARIAERVCRRHSCPGLMLAYLRGMFCYCLFGRAGELVDASIPPTAEPDVGSTREQLQGLLGRPEAIAEVFAMGITREQVRQALTDPSKYFFNLCRLLDLKNSHYSYGSLFKEVDEPYHLDPRREEWGIVGWGEFVHVGGPDPRWRG